MPTDKPKPSLKRRDFIRGTAAISIAAPIVASLTDPAAATPLARTAFGEPISSSRPFHVPAAATRRALGAIVPGPTTPGGGGIPGLPVSVPGLGIPLGGIGAGTFMINQAGTFGPWFFGGSQSDSWEMRALPQAAFHVREQIGNAPAVVKTLATKGPQNESYPQARSWESPLAAWNVLKPGEGNYAALYPFGWIDYTTLTTKVSTRFFSPFVARDERRSSLPLAYFDVRLENPTRNASRVSVMFTMPNVAAHVGRKPDTVRTGLASRYRHDARSGIHAVTLSADSPSNTPDAKNSEWTIAVDPQRGQTVSHASSWNAAGDGSDIYQAFSGSGHLPNAAIDTSASAGAIAVTVTLKPGESTTVPFVLTWDFPQVAFADNKTIWMRRYTNFYGAKETRSNDYVPGSYPFNRSFVIARDGLQDHTRALRAVEGWWRPIAEEKAYPLVLRTAALNHLAQITWKTSLWEGGLVSNAVTPTSGRRLGSSVPGTHLYLSVDSNAGGGANGGMGTEVGTYSYLALTQLFPSIERDRLQAKIEAVLVDPSGDPGDPGLTSSTLASDYQSSGDPYITWLQGPADPGPGTVWFIDRPSENLFRLYDYSRTHRDAAFLRRAYPAMKKLLAYVQATIPSGSVLPEAPSLLNPNPGLKSPLPFANTYDIIPVNRFDSYTSQLYLLALTAIIEAGTQLRESKRVLAGWRNQLQQAKAGYEALFWSESHHYYRYTPGPTADNDAVLLATFFAQHLAERSGLNDLVDLRHLQTHLTTQSKLFTELTDSQGRSIGLANIALPPGATGFPYQAPFGGNAYENGVWAGANYVTAAENVRAARRFRNDTYRRQGLSMAEASAQQIWQVQANGYEFNPPLQWSKDNAGEWIYPSFETNLGIWELITELKPPRLPRN